MSSGQANLTPILPAAEITPEWITAALGKAGIDAKVSSLTAKKFGTGQVGESVRFTLTYDGDANGAPATVVGKFPSQDPESRATGVNFGNYVREVNFYRQLASTALVTTPKVLFTDVNEETCDFVLLMEDLAPAVQGDQMRGVTLEQAALSVDQAARLAASHWGEDHWDQVPWLHGVAAAPAAAGPDLMRQLWLGFRDRYGARIPAECIRIGEKLTLNFDRFRLGYEGPRGLTHNDFRPDNMMYGTAEGGYPVAVVDWQSLGYGCCMADVSYFLAGALSPADRKANEHELLKGYHARLTQLGVRDYPFEKMMQDYALYSFSLFNMAYAASMIVERTERGDNMFFSMLESGTAQILDHDALRLLD
jgi:hypothetical protein